MTASSASWRLPGPRAPVWIRVFSSLLGWNDRSAKGVIWAALNIRPPFRITAPCVRSALGGEMRRTQRSVRPGVETALAHPARSLGGIYSEYPQHASWSGRGQKTGRDGCVRTVDAPLCQIAYVGRSSLRAASPPNLFGVTSGPRGSWLLIAVSLRSGSREPVPPTAQFAYQEITGAARPAGRIRYDGDSCFA